MFFFPGDRCFLSCSDVKLNASPDVLPAALAEAAALNRFNQSVVRKEKEGPVNSLPMKEKRM